MTSAVRVAIVSGSWRAGTWAPGTASHGTTRDSIQPTTSIKTQPVRPVIELARLSGRTNSSAPLKIGAHEPPETYPVFRDAASSAPGGDRMP